MNKKGEYLRQMVMVCLIWFLTAMAGFSIEAKEEPVLNRAFSEKAKTGTVKFIIYNQGQTAGSFIISILQEKGIPCVDELFNKRGIHPGRKFSKVFRHKKQLYSGRPTSIKEAFNLLRKCEPLSEKYLGLKICGGQKKSASDFEEILRDKDILKVFLYRKDDIRLYLARFFFYKLRLKSKKGFSGLRYNPSPFHHYEKLIASCRGKVVEVACEDFFDFKVNSATKLCQRLGLNDIEVKNLAVKKIWNSQIILMKEILTETELTEMVKFFNMKYSFDELANMELRDCRGVFLNLGFL